MLCRAAPREAWRGGTKTLLTTQLKADSIRQMACALAYGRALDHVGATTRSTDGRSASGARVAAAVEKAIHVSRVDLLRLHESRPGHRLASRNGCDQVQRRHAFEQKKAAPERGLSDGVEPLSGTALLRSNPSAR